VSHAGNLGVTTIVAHLGGDSGLRAVRLLLARASALVDHNAGQLGTVASGICAFSPLRDSTNQRVANHGLTAAASTQQRSLQTSLAAAAALALNA
jgi:hypothetical protein